MALQVKLPMMLPIQLPALPRYESRLAKLNFFAMRKKIMFAEEEIEAGRSWIIKQPWSRLLPKLKNFYFDLGFYSVPKLGLLMPLAGQLRINISLIKFHIEAELLKMAVTRERRDSCCWVWTNYLLLEGNFSNRYVTASAKFYLHILCFLAWEHS